MRTLARGVMDNAEPTLLEVCQSRGESLDPLPLLPSFGHGQATSLAKFREGSSRTSTLAYKETGCNQAASPHTLSAVNYGVVATSKLCIKTFNEFSN